MSVRANWHLSNLALDDDQDMTDLFAIAKPLDLSRGKAELSAELQLLAKREVCLANEGVECELKWREGHSCFTCPLYTDDPGEPRNKICYVGRAQEGVVRQLDTHREIEELERMAIDHFVADEADELATYALP